MKKRQKIMVVDDSSMNLMMVEEILQEDYELLCLTSGEEALAQVDEWRPDLVLLDIMMPGMGGYETCSRLRKLDSMRHAKIILVSAKVEVEDRLQGYERGADDYLTKPFDGDELQAKVKVFLRLKTAEEMDSIKKDILRLLNHETRTPLNGVLGYLDLVEDLRGELDGPEQELLTAARECGHNLTRLLEKCLLYSNLVSGVARIERSTVDFGERLTKVLRNSRVVAEHDQVMVRLAAVKPVLVAADPQLLDFMANALIENAVRHSPDGSEVTVDFYQDQGRIFFSVADCGPGVSPQYRPFLFDAFVPEDLNHHSEGHGLSLAIVKMILELHGGACTVSDNPGGGSCFEIVLPARAGADENFRVSEPALESSR